MENKKKALIITTTPYMIKQFLMNDIKILKELGYEVEVGTNFKTFNVISEDELKSFKEKLELKKVKINQINFTRSIFDLKSIYRSFKETRNLINIKQYDIIHTHTPIASLVSRIANKHSINYNNRKMIYTAHGFHFFKGNSFFKNFLFKNIERYGAKYTDVLITINKEDYDAAKKFKLKKNGNVEYIPGVGVDINKINLIQGNKKGLCEKLNISTDSILLLSVGELNENKNHKVVIESLPKLPSNVHYLICGIGDLKDKYISLANQLGVMDRLHLLGFREDVIKIMKSSDVFVFPSKREGLSVSLMEAMGCGIPCVVSNIRGNNDLIDDNINGKLVRLDTSQEWSDSIKKVLKMKNYYPKSMETYDYKKINHKIQKIYTEVLKDE